RQAGRRPLPGARPREPAGRSSEGPLAMPTLFSTVFALHAAVRVLTLHDALEMARAHQPQLRQAHADTEAAGAVADEARAPLLPQITATASYARATANDIARPGVAPSSNAAARGSSAATSNFYSTGVTVYQLLYDFGQTSQKWRAQEALVQAAAQLE